MENTTSSYGEVFFPLFFYIFRCVGIGDAAAKKKKILLLFISGKEGGEKHTLIIRDAMGGYVILKND